MVLSLVITSDQFSVDVSTQGFTHPEIFRLIILPQVIRLSVPSLTNQVIQNLKDTSVAFLIQYPDFFAQIQEIASTNFQFFKAYVTAGLVYLALVSIIVLGRREDWKSD